MKNRLLATFTCLCALTMQTVAAEVITEQPDGTLYETVQGSTEISYLSYNGMLASTKTDVGYRTEIVIDGNDFYVHNILHFYENGESWIKGTLNADNIVEFTFPQTVYALPEKNFEVNINMLEAKIEDNVTSYVITSGENVLRMNWDGHTLTQIKPGTGAGLDGFFGLTHEEGRFIGYGALGLELEIVETPAVALPEGVQFRSDEYSCTYKDKFGDDVKSLMNIYRSEGSDEVFISGLNSTDYKQLVKGVVDADGNIVIESAQFMGLTYAEGLDNFVYCYAATPAGQSSYEWADKAVLVNDNGVYKADKTILINLGNKYPLLGLSLEGLTMTSMDDIVRTPAAPYLFLDEPETRFEWSEDEGMMGGGFGFDCLSTDGEPLDPDMVFFNVYFDGELQTTSINGEPCTDIPNTVEMTDDMLFFNTMTGYYCIFGFEPVKKVGIQVIYHNRNGEVTKSEMLIATVDGYSSIGSIETDGNVVRVEYFNMQGVAVAEPTGLCVVRTTYSDGSIKTHKSVFKK